jgi:hypothetical protein
MVFVLAAFVNCFSQGKGALQCSPIICSDSARPPELFSKHALKSGQLDYATIDETDALGHKDPQGVFTEGTGGELTNAVGSSKLIDGPPKK